jgi:hypothetical protein
MVMSSVAAAQGDIFATLGNKIAGTLDIFVEVDHLISGGPLLTLSDLISSS